MGWISVVTNAGRSLLNQYSQGGHTLTLTDATVGSGTVAEANLRSRTSVSSEKASASIVKVEARDDYVKYVVQVGPAATTAYVAHQIGIWARLDSGVRTLLMLAQDGDTGVSIPTRSASPAFAFGLYITLSVNNTENLVVNIDSSAYVTQADLTAGLAGITPRAINAYGNSSLPTPITDANNYNLFGTITLNGSACANLPSDNAYYVLNFMGRSQIATKIDGSANVALETSYRCYVNDRWYPWLRIDAAYATHYALPLTGGDVNGNINVNGEICFPSNANEMAGVRWRTNDGTDFRWDATPSDNRIFLDMDAGTLMMFDSGGTFSTDFAPQIRRGLGALACVASGLYNFGQIPASGTGVAQNATVQIGETLDSANYMVHTEPLTGHITVGVQNKQRGSFDLFVRNVSGQQADGQVRWFILM